MLNKRFVYGEGIDEILRATLPDAADLDGDLNTAEAVDLYYHHNSLGSVVAVTDAAGNIAESYEYKAYGEVSIFDSTGAPTVGNATEVEQPFMFTGRRWDFEEGSGLYYYRLRYYDPVDGRFVSRDPLGNWGDAAHKGNAQNYCANNPVNFIDPMGQDVWQTPMTNPDDMRGGGGGGGFGGGARGGPRSGPRTAPKSGKSGKSGKSAKSAKSAKSGKSGKSAKHDSRVRKTSPNHKPPSVQDELQGGFGGSSESASGHPALPWDFVGPPRRGQDRADPCPPTAGGGSGTTPPGPPAPPGAPWFDPFEENFDSFEDAIGLIGEEIDPDGIDKEDTRDPGAKAQGYTEKWVGDDSDGNRWSAFYNPITGKFSGGKPSMGGE